MSFLWATTQPTQTQVVDGFEDGGLSEYPTTSGNPTVQSNTVFNGTFALKLAVNGFFEEAVSTGGLPNYPDQGQRYRFYQRTDTVSSGESFAGYGTQSVDDTYRAAWDQDKSEIRIEKLVGGQVTTLASTPFGGTAGTWYEFIVEWTAAADHTLEVQDTGGTTVAGPISATDTTYVDGGILWRAVDTNGQHNWFFDLATVEPI